MSEDGATGMDGLVSDRLRFGRPMPDDVAAIYAIHGDSRTYQHKPDGVMRDPAEAAALCQAWQRHWDVHGFGYATIRCRDHEESSRSSGACGEILGFAGLKWQALLGHGVLNLYYRFAPEAWGRGYASEAATALARWAEREHPGARVLARVAANNPASRRVAERAGLRAVVETDPGDPIPHVLLLSRPW